MTHFLLSLSFEFWDNVKSRLNQKPYYGKCDQVWILLPPIIDYFILVDKKNSILSEFVKYYISKNR